MRSSSANTIDLCSRVLTFGNDLLHGDLVPSDGEALANEIPASMTGPGGAAATSRTGPGAHQLAAGIEELPHGAEATGGVFVTSITHTHRGTRTQTRVRTARSIHRIDGNAMVKTGAPHEPDLVSGQQPTSTHKTRTDASASDDDVEADLPFLPPLPV